MEFKGGQKYNINFVKRYSEKIICCELVFFLIYINLKMLPLNLMILMFLKGKL